MTLDLSHLTAATRESYGVIGPFLRGYPSRSASRFPPENRSGESSMVGRTPGELAIRISALPMDPRLGNDVNRTAHGKLDINC